MPPYESLIDHFGDPPVEDVYSLPQLRPPSRLLMIYTMFRRRLRLLVLYGKAVWSLEPQRDVVRPLLYEVRRLCAVPEAILREGLGRDVGAGRSDSLRRGVTWPCMMSS